MSTVDSEAERLVDGYRVYQMMVAACELRIPDLVASEPKSAQELAVATDTHEPSLRRFLRGLAACQIVSVEPGDRFAATPLSDRFRSDRPGLRDRTIQLNDDGYLAWAALTYTLRTGKPAYDHVFGKSRFELLGEHPDQATRFNAAMVENTKRVAAAFIGAYEFTGVTTVVDVGGGNGALLAALLNTHPLMRGILFDLPQGLAGARDRLTGDGVDDRTTLVEGDFFESVPSGGDLYLLKWIVHDWDDERAAAILKVCRLAMPRSARLVLLERVFPDRLEAAPMHMNAVIADLQMMVVLGGRERTPDEYGRLLAAGGFRMTRWMPATGTEFGIFEAVAH